LKKPQSVVTVIEKKQTYLLKLYITGDEQNSRLARENLKGICDKYLKDRCQIEEVDVLIDFASALKDRIFVTPTLVLMSPEPRVTIVGNLGDKERAISALRLSTTYGT
jgi:circadian clock protein KaiB